MKRLLTVTLTLFVVLSISIPARAQAPTPVLINGTIPVSTQVRDALNAWLAVSAPNPAPYYAVTYTQPIGPTTLVSLVALDIPSPDADWSLEDGNAVWLGTVRVSSDGMVSPFSQEQAKLPHLKVLANFSPAPGGGSYVSFPWQSGKAVIYGIRAIHGEGDYGTTGMFAVDFVSGLDLGSAAADDKAYASDAGTIDYICDDDTTVAVRTHNETTGDYFVYAHLLANDGLALASSFTRGQALGTLKSGTFDDSCGWAEQQENHWHLHWMFTPANGAFAAEGCVLNFTDKKWHCGATETIGTGAWIIGGGGSTTSTGAGHDDPAGKTGYEGSGTAPVESSFWDLLLVGIAFLIDPFFKLAPQHQGFQFIQTIYYGVALIFRLLLVFAYGNINLGPIIATFMAVVAFKAIMFAFQLFGWAVRIWRQIKQAFVV